MEFSNEQLMGMLDNLVNHSDSRVRIAVAEAGYGHEILAHDKSENVRLAVARAGGCLDVLMKDKSSTVRQAVAAQGYGLDILLYDEDVGVRETAKAMLERQKVIGIDGILADAQKRAGNVAEADRNMNFEIERA